MDVWSQLGERVRKMYPGAAANGGSFPIRLIGMGVLGVALLLAGNAWDAGFFRATPQPTETLTPLPPALPRSYEEALEGKLANLLSQVKGAGAVAVNITLESGAVQEHAKNIIRENRTVQEKDINGGVRTTTESKETEQLILTKENGADHPVVVKEVKPAIKGVLVIAEGASDSMTKASLTKAVEATLGIPSYKITVLPQRR